jgi:hypothetical protein
MGRRISMRTDLAEQDFTIRWYDMVIDEVEGRFVVCKLRRVSSPPVLVGSVSNSLESSFQRLVDIIRLGRESRNYADLKAVEWWLKEAWGTDAEAEWTGYEQVICRSLGVDRLEPILPSVPPPPTARPSLPAVTFHEAQMRTLPYLVAQIGGIYGSPAPVFLTWGHERESALERLGDVFRIGVRGQAFRDFLEAGRKLGMSEVEVVGAWQACEWVMNNGDWVSVECD